MTNEAKLLVETQLAVPMTCADGTAIAKGTLLQLNDLNTASAVTADTAVVAGIAKSEKIASDGMTKIDVYRGGIFRVTASGSITVGDVLALDYHNEAANYVYTVGASGSSTSGSRIIGIAMETATDDETFRMELNIQNLPDTR